MWAPITSGGDEHRRAALDRLPLERVVAVAGPDAVGALQDRVVDPAAAARAALDLDVRMAGAQLVEQPVQRERLRVRPRGAVGTAPLHVIAVHVPLDERDVVIAQQRVEVIEHVCVRTGMGDVQHQLLATEHRVVAGRRQRPLRVRAEQVAVRVDHLRLDPDPELHPERADVVDQRGETRRVHLGRHRPVTEPTMVVAA
jgi:hypothetical protein